MRKGDQKSPARKIVPHRRASVKSADPVSPLLRGARLALAGRALDAFEHADLVGFLQRVAAGTEVVVHGRDHLGALVSGAPTMQDRREAIRILAQLAGADRPLEAERQEIEQAVAEAEAEGREDLVRELLGAVRRLARVAAPADDVVEAEVIEDEARQLPAPSEAEGLSPDSAGS